MHWDLLKTRKRPTRRFVVSGNSGLRQGIHHRRLRCEPLEERALLSLSYEVPVPLETAFGHWVTSSLVKDFSSDVAHASLVTSIEGIDFDQDAANSGFYHIPPDPIGAAGPSHVVSVVNTSIEWHTKAGVQQSSQSLSAFFLHTHSG